MCERDQVLDENGRSIVGPDPNGSVDARGDDIFRVADEVGEGEGRIVADEPEMTLRYDGADFTLRTDSPALLVMPLNYALGLEARINGDRAEVWRVNGALSGVIVPKGASLAEVRVIPDSYRWIALSQAVCGVLLFGLLAAAAIRSRRTTPGTL